MDALRGFWMNNNRFFFVIIEHRSTNCLNIFFVINSISSIPSLFDIFTLIHPLVDFRVPSIEFAILENCTHNFFTFCRLTPFRSFLWARSGCFWMKSISAFTCARDGLDGFKYILGKYSIS